LSCDELDVPALPEPRPLPPALEVDLPLTEATDTPANALRIPPQRTPSPLSRPDRPDGSPSKWTPSKWKKNLRIEVEEAEAKKQGDNSIPTPPTAAPITPDLLDPDMQACFFSPVPSAEGAITFDQLELHLLGYSPATSTLRSVKSGSSLNGASSGGSPDDPTPGKKPTSGTPRSARVLGNFGFHNTPPPAKPAKKAPDQAERLIVIL